MATSLEKRARRLGAPVSTHSHLSPTAFRFRMGFFMVVVSLFFLTTGMYSGGRSALTFFGARAATFSAGATAVLEQAGAVLMGILGALFLWWTRGEPHRITVRIHEASSPTPARWCPAPRCGCSPGTRLPRWHCERTAAP